MDINKKLQVETEIVRRIKNIFDPEIPVNIYDLGLIYEVGIDNELNVSIDMTLTAPNCPVADQLPLDVKNTIKEIEGVKNVDVNIVFDPPWDKSMMSEEARLELGLF